MTAFAELHVNDRVRHVDTMLAEGTVLNVVDEFVTIGYDTGGIGTYDRAWFKLYGRKIKKLLLAGAVQ